MDFLGTLVTPSRRTRYGAEAGAPAGILIIDPKTNPLPLATTPPAIYALINGGGFVVWDQSTAGELARRGFSVSTHDVLPAEAAWLTANSQSWVAQGRPMLVWFLICPGAVTLDAQGLPVCGGLGIPGVSEVAPKPGTDACSVASLPESIEGEVTTAQLEAAKRLAPPGTTVCFRYFAGNPGKPTPAQESASRTTIQNYDRLSQSVEQMSAQRQRTGRPLSLGDDRHRQRPRRARDLRPAGGEGASVCDACGLPERTPSAWGSRGITQPVDRVCARRAGGDRRKCCCRDRGDREREDERGDHRRAGEGQRGGAADDRRADEVCGGSGPHRCPAPVVRGRPQRDAGPCR